MRFTQTLHDAAEATREYIKGIDRATAIRRLFAFWMAFTIVVGIVPPTVLYAGGPDVSPVGTASAEPYNISDASAVRDKSLDMTHGGDWSANGKYFVAATFEGNITIYQASDRWNVSTLSFHSETTVSVDDAIYAILIGKNGTRIYFADAGGTNQKIRQLELSTAYDASTATETDSINFGGSGDWFGLYIRPDGSELYVTTQNQDDLEKYSLSNNWELSSASQTDAATLDLTNFDFGYLYDLHFNDDGTKLIVYGPDHNGVDAFMESKSLSEAWNISSVTGTVRTRQISGERYGLDFGQDGARMYDMASSVREWELTTGYVSGTVTYASNGTVVEGASISVNASSVSDSTDANGFYSVPLDNGTYEITAIKDIVDGPKYTGTTTVTVSGSDVTNANITVTREAEVELDVPTQMFPNETAAYKVYDVQADGSKVDITDSATVTSSDPTNLTVNQTSNELESTSDTSFAGEINITATFEDDSASRNVTVANLSAENVGLMQNAADMTAAIWGDVPDAQGDRPGGTQLTMRVLFVALLIGAAIATHASGFAGIGGITLIVVMGWFMGWVSDGMTMVTVFTGLFIGLNLAANIDYSVRSG